MILGFPSGSVVKNPPAMQKIQVQSLGTENPLEEEMAAHSSVLAWRIPWTEEPGRLQSMGSLRVRHDWATSFSLSCIGEGNGSPLQCSCLENPRDGGAWWAAVCGVAHDWSDLAVAAVNRQILEYLHVKHFWSSWFGVFMNVNCRCPRSYKKDR